MQFNTYTFLLFFVVVFLVHMAPLPWRVKKLNLVVASLFFYAAWRVPYLLLLLGVATIDWLLANALAKQTSTGRRRALLLVSVVTNLGLLAFFKYAQFLAITLSDALGIAGVEWTAPQFEILLPLGISFFTFETLSYTIDVYRRALTPARSFLDYALFISFFPRLVSGPIVRAAEFLPQLESARRPTAQDIGWGAMLFLIGLWQKTAVADAILAPVVEGLFDSPALGVWDAWSASIAFAGQVFFDFAGYSTCAIGLARCLGFRLPINFRCPYSARGFTDFWQRWHISLSAWLRDYLFVALGMRGSRFRIYRNLMITMLLGGLWHGPAWTFVIWGGLHGAFLIIERELRAHVRGPEAGVPAFLAIAGAQIVTFAAWCISITFFRSATLGDAWRMVKAMLGFTGGGEGGSYDGAEEARIDFGLAGGFLQFTQTVAALVVAALIIAHTLLRDVDLERAMTRMAAWKKSVLIAALLLMILLLSGEDRAFIYFQF